MAQMQHRVLAVLCIGALAAACASAAPFAKTFRFTQPDGRQIEVWGEGDEFRAVFEHRGYTIVWDEATKAYTYARLSADETELISTGLLVGRDDPALNGLPQHLRITPVAAAEQARFEHSIIAFGIGHAHGHVRAEKTDPFERPALHGVGGPG